MVTLGEFSWVCVRLCGQCMPLVYKLVLWPVLVFWYAARVRVPLGGVLCGLSLQPAVCEVERTCQTMAQRRDRPHKYVQSMGGGNGVLP